jgi:very-short-patch-repair endonuclease
MRPEIDVVLAARGGAASRADLFTVVTRNQLDDEVARGHLVAVFPRAYCRPWDLDDPAVLEAAAVHSVGAPVVLSHVNALRRWSLPTPPQRVVHVTVPADRHPMGRRPGLFVHRTRVRLRARTVDGLLTVAPAVAVVRSWPMLTGPEQRGPAIAAVRDRLVGVDDLRAAASAAPGLSGRKRLFELIDLLAAGCESELEIWGHLGVFDVPGLRHGKRQLWVSTAAGPYRADIGYEEERVAVELDGHRFHGGQAQRERDMRRDAALAAMGWLTLRFSHQRLHDDVDGCRRDTLAALAARRRRAS